MCCREEAEQMCKRFTAETMWTVRGELGKNLVGGEVKGILLKGVRYKYFLKETFVKSLLIMNDCAILRIMERWICT